VPPLRGLRTASDPGHPVRASDTSRLRWHDCVNNPVSYENGDRVRYIAAPVFDGIVDTGEIGLVERVEAGWVFAWWPRSGLHSVPLTNVEPADD
jgi:hypothetical protein